MFCYHTGTVQINIKNVKIISCALHSICFIVFVTNVPRKVTGKQSTVHVHVFDFSNAWKMCYKCFKSTYASFYVFRYALGSVFQTFLHYHSPHSIISFWLPYPQNQTNIENRKQTVIFNNNSNNNDTPTTTTTNNNNYNNSNNYYYYSCYYNTKKTTYANIIIVLILIYYYHYFYNREF